MKERVARLSRIHALRCRLADAATSERKRIGQEIDGAEQALMELQSAAAEATGRASHAESPWYERRAQLEIALRQTECWTQRRAGLLAAEAEANTREHAAVQGREQVSRIVSRMERDLRSEAERREQMRLDDLFAVARVRAAMATSF